MSLQVWLPLTKDLRNQGLSNVTVTNNGATFNSAGKLGGCYTFDGTDDFINLGNISSYFTGSTHPFSICFWIYSSESGTRGVIFSSYGLTSTSNFFSLEINSGSVTNNSLRFDWKASPDWASDIILTPNIWIHVGITYDGTSVRFYKNGNLVQTKNQTLSSLSTSNNWYLGRDNRTGTTAFNGRLNDVRIYDHCLSEKEVKELSKGLVLHYPLNRQGWGQNNLLKNSNFLQGTNGMQGYTAISATCTKQTDSMKVVSTSASGGFYSSNFDSITTGDITIFSADVKADSNMTIYIGTDGWGNGSCQAYTVGTSWQRISISKAKTTNNANLRIYGNGTFYVKNLKYELGSIATPWCPNSSDVLATTLGLNGTTEYDCSGYCNNGIKNNIAYTSDTPKYNVSSIFNGTNSYIKVIDNNWMVKGMSEMTVNLWAKATTWPTNGGRLVSCTESGGFNLEAGNSGYWRFPIYVYTNSGQTSSAYKYDSNEIKIADLIPNEWNMITLVYETTGTKTYINGELHHTYTNTSYGINFNTNARLFLGCEANTASPSSPYFNGKECDFRIYATALSADDIKSLYQNGAIIDANGTIHGQIR